MTTGERFAAARERAGLTQTSAAAIFAVNPRTISRWEARGEDHIQADGAAASMIDAFVELVEGKTVREAEVFGASLEKTIRDGGSLKALSDMLKEHFSGRRV